jgi:hypothetical protein
MFCRKELTIFLLLLHRVVGRTVVFNYKSNMDTREEDIDTFVEGAEDLDDGLRLFLHALKHNMEENKMVNRKIPSMNMDIFKTFILNVVDDNDDFEEKDSVEIIKTWKLEDIL